MSREPRELRERRHRFPRVSGDEPPIVLVIAAIAAFSPRERDEPERRA